MPHVAAAERRQRCDERRDAPPMPMLLMLTESMMMAKGAMPREMLARCASDVYELLQRHDAAAKKHDER